MNTNKHEYNWDVDVKMMKSIIMWMFVWIFSNTAFSAYIYFGDPNDAEYQKYRQAEQRLIESKPDLAALQKQYAKDKDILSGLAFLYRRYSELQSGLECSPYELFKLALEIDPNDKPLLFQATFSDVMRYDSKRYFDLEDGIKGLIQNAKQRNSKAIIRPKSSFSKYFKEELEKEKAQKQKASARYEIQDPNRAVSKVKSILDQEGRDLLKSIHKAQSIDDNAGYHYLKARVYLLLDDTKNAIAELESGSQKQMTTHLSERKKRAQEVLNAIDYPESMQFYILDGDSPFEDFINTRIWNPGPHVYSAGWDRSGLKAYSAEQEKKGNYSEAKRVYRLLDIIAEQCQPEQIRPLGLGKTMKKKLEDVQKREQEVSDLPLRN